MNLTQRLGTTALLAGVLVGTAFAQDVTVTPDPLDLGSIEAGMTIEGTLNLADGANNTFSVTVEPAGDFTASATVTLDDNGSGTVVVTYAPLSGGADTATVNIVNTDGMTVGSAAVSGSATSDDNLVMAILDIQGELGSLAAFQAASNTGDDLDNDGLPEEFAIALIAVGAADATEGSTLAADSQAAYEANLAAILAVPAKQDDEGSGEGSTEGSGESVVVALGDYPELFAALAIQGAAAQTAIDGITTETLPDDLTAVTNEAGGEIYSGAGDYDGDGSSNAAEYIGAAEFNENNGTTLTTSAFTDIATDPDTNKIDGDRFCPGGSSYAPPSFNTLKTHAGDMAGFALVAATLLFVAAARRRRQSNA